MAFRKFFEAFVTAKTTTRKPTIPKETSSGTSAHAASRDLQKPG
jgi:hypothetical protein